MGPNYLLIDGKLNKICNFHCSYCFKQDEDLKCANPSKEEIEQALSTVNTFPFEKFHILFSGGEPTLYENLDFFVEKTVSILKNKLGKLTIISNCSKDFSASILNNKKVQIYYSVHSEYGNKEHTTKVIKTVSKSACQLYVAVMYNPAEIEKCNEILEEIRKLKEIYSFQAKVILIRQYPHFETIDERYTKEDIQFVHEWNTLYGVKNNVFGTWEFPDHNEELEKGKLNFKNYYCCQGTEVLRINEDGICSGSICKCAHSSYFSIYKGISPYILDFPRFIKCKADQCGCKDNMPIEKFKSKEAAERYLSHKDIVGENLLKNNKSM